MTQECQSYSSPQRHARLFKHWHPDQRTRAQCSLFTRSLPSAFSDSQSTTCAYSFQAFFSYYTTVLAPGVQIEFHHTICIYKQEYILNKKLYVMAGMWLKVKSYRQKASGFVWGHLRFSERKLFLGRTRWWVVWIVFKSQQAKRIQKAFFF